VLRDRLASAGAEELLAWSCMERLVGRGYDADIERYCRRRIAANADDAVKLRPLLDKLGWTPLHVAADRRDRDGLRELLADKVDVNARARDGRTPLHVAAAGGDAVIVAMLVKAGALLDAKNSAGQTPVQMASFEDRVEVVRFLVAKGCGVPDILTATNAGRRDAVEAMLKADPSRVNATTQHKRTSLHLAALQGREDIAKRLLDWGASVDAADENDCTPLHVAVAVKHEPMVRLLLDRKANTA
jgi:ankyrin repeat protein